MQVELNAMHAVKNDTQLYYCKVVETGFKDCAVKYSKMIVMQQYHCQVRKIKEALMQENEPRIWNNLNWIVTLEYAKFCHMLRL